MNQPIDTVHLWEQIPYETFVKLVDLKQQANKSLQKNKEFEADPYTEAKWLEQFGVQEE